MLASLATDRARVADLDTEILVLERSLSALRSQRDRVQERLDSYIYPVLTLPNEIVAEIFIHFLPNYPHCAPFTGLESPTLLTQICRKWRSIALATPALWRAISLPDPDIPPAEQGALLEAWLSRCQAYPISLQFDTRLVEDKLEPEIPITIVPYRARLEHLVVNQVLLPLLWTIEGPMPLLRHLELLFRDEDDSSPAKASFLEAPLLRSVLLNADAFRSTLIPWAQLTSLALLGLFPRECTPILQQTSNLVHCELVLVQGLADENVPDVTLPSLQSLILSHILKNDAITWYLQTLTTPGLRSLRVPETFLGPNPIDTLKSFVLKSGCKLEKLCVTGTRSGFDSFYQMAFPSTKVSFAQWTVSSAEWIRIRFGDPGDESDQLSTTASE